MPGLAGFASRIHQPITLDALESQLNGMCDLLTHYDFYQRGGVYTDSDICGAHVHTGIRDTLGCKHDGQIMAWAHGEIYTDNGVHDPVQVIYEWAQHGCNPQALPDIDGVYAAVVYDRASNTLSLLTDRHGLGTLNYTLLPDGLAWASETKAFLALEGFTPQIDVDVLRHFITHGQMHDNVTWFKNVYLLPAGTLLRWQRDTDEITMTRYWSWDDISPVPASTSHDELAHELARRFIAGMRRRCHPGERTGVWLSGGLDSRLIVAAMPETIEPLHTVTFGKSDSSDIHIARRVSDVRGAIHHVFLLDEKNWLAPRLNGIWWTDGEKNLMHMHGIEIGTRTYRDFNISHSGFLGDATIGGSYLDYNGKTEYEIYRNRGRRLIRLGTRLSETYMSVRYPFFDNAFFDLGMGIPTSIRRDSYIYKKMLLHAFPQYFKTIPWQQLGFPISWSHRLTPARHFWGRLTTKSYKEIRLALGLAYSDPRYYTDYARWLREEPARSFLSDLFSSGEALYTAYLPREEVLHLWQDHLSGAKHHDKVCRYATLEIWLQQVYNGRFRPEVKR
ncbi:hypothetical protein HC928_12215 [bacterium]|nr:hypothetical protein [bacterium]